MEGPGFNEGEGSPFTAADVRFTAKGDTLYAFVLGAPDSAIRIQALGTESRLLDAGIASVTLLGSNEKLTWSQAADALVIETPHSVPNEIAAVFRIEVRR